MKREVKAAIGLTIALLAGLLAFWASQRGAAGLAPSPSKGESEVATSRPLAPVPPPRNTPDRQPPLPQPGASPGASPAQPSQSPSSPTLPPAKLETRGQDEGFLTGRVVGPGGGPVATKIYVFAVVPRLNPTYSDFGGETPTEVEAVARSVSQGRGSFLGVSSSDGAGRFSLKGVDSEGPEVVLVAAAEEGVGALRVKRGFPDLVLVLEARRSLQVQIVSGQRDLSRGSLGLDLGQAGRLEFPPLDSHGATRLDLPVGLSAKTFLRFQQPDWLPLRRDLTPAELAGGRVTWSLPTDLANLRGKVQDPSGAAWVEGPVQFMFRDEGSEKWRHLEVSTDDEGAFLAQGFPPGQRLRVRVAGTAKHAYHRAIVRADGSPILIQLQAASVLRVRVERFEGDVDAIEAEWKLERREGERFEEVDLFLYGRVPRRFPAYEGELERRFGLRIGVNEVLGLPAGRYRVSLEGFGGSQAVPVEVELPPAGAATCELGVKERPATTFRLLLVSGGADLGGLAVSITYTQGRAEVLQTPTLDEQGGLKLRLRITKPTEVQILVPGLRLGAKVTLDPKAPDLGTVVLQGD